MHIYFSYLHVHANFGVKSRNVKRSLHNVTHVPGTIAAMGINLSTTITTLHDVPAPTVAVSLL